MSRNGSALGTLSWVTVLTAEPLTVLSCAIAPGTVLCSKNELVNPSGQKIVSPTSLIHLAAGEYRACLSDVLPQIMKRVRELEITIEKGLKDTGDTSTSATVEAATVDVFIAMTISFAAAGGNGKGKNSRT